MMLQLYQCCLRPALTETCGRECCQQAAPAWLQLQLVLQLLGESDHPEQGVT